MVFLSIEKLLPCQNQHGFIRSKENVIITTNHTTKDTKICVKGGDIPGEEYGPT